MNVRSKRNIEKLAHKICADINSEKYTIPEICNNYKVEKGALIKKIQEWKTQGYISKQVKIQFNPNRKPGPNTQVAKVSVEPTVNQEQHKTFWWEDSGIENRPRESTFNYTHDHSTAKVEHSRFLIYTDGSCLFENEEDKQGAGGWAIICLDRENSGSKERRGFKQKATPLEMELKAIEEGIRYIPEGETATLFTDSKQSIAIIQQLDKWKNRGWRDDFNRTPANLDILLNIQELKEKRSVNIQWVKGHNSDPMNTRCDELAKDAANRQISTEMEEKEQETVKAEKPVEQTEMTITDAAKYLGIDVSYLRQLGKHGRVVTTGARPVKISIEEIERLEKLKKETGSFTGITRGGYRAPAAKKKTLEQKLPEVIEIISKKELEVDTVAVECTKEEYDFADICLRYGLDKAAKAFNMSLDDAEVKWMRFFADYEVRLDIKKKH